jgi:hypothetical protein
VREPGLRLGGAFRAQRALLSGLDAEKGRLDGGRVAARYFVSFATLNVVLLLTPANVGRTGADRAGAGFVAQGSIRGAVLFVPDHEAIHPRLLVEFTMPDALGPQTLRGTAAFVAASEQQGRTQAQAQREAGAKVVGEVHAGRSGHSIAGQHMNVGQLNTSFGHHGVSNHNATNEPRE